MSSMDGEQNAVPALAETNGAHDLEALITLIEARVVENLTRAFERVAQERDRETGAAGAAGSRTGTGAGT